MRRSTLARHSGERRSVLECRCRRSDTGWQRRHAGTPELLPIRVATRSNVGLELEIGEVVVRLPESVEPAYVAELVRALRSC